MLSPKVLILTIPHGAAHKRLADALLKALLEIQPQVTAEVVDALRLCARWFRAYYDSYKIPLKYWPALWGWIENAQHYHESTGPGWLYRRGGQGLFRFLERFGPDIVIATEVATCELAAMFKRERHARFCLVGAPTGVDIDRAWAQPEVDLYFTMPGEVARQLEAAGVPPTKIIPCGVPIDPSFGSLPPRAQLRARLGLEPDVPMILVLFGGVGHGKPRRIAAELKRISQPLQAVFIAGKNPRLEEEARIECQDQPRFRVLGWVANMHEWLAAADLLVSKPGAMTVIEAINSALPLLAFDPLPGNERRACDLIERWQVGLWVRRPEGLAPAIERLLSHPDQLQRFRSSALSMARPAAALNAARTILERWGPCSQR
jgi:processive 1,2-diacylglycerol beta-glucosyltransferase